MKFAYRTSWKTRFKRRLLDFDGWMNNSSYESGRDLSEFWRRYTRFTDVVRFRGAPRFVLGMASEGLTLGLAGLFVLVALAMPAFDKTHGDWLRTEGIAVTFLDRNGNEIGHRGLRHDDSVALSEYPDNLIKATLATEDRRFFEHWGIDPVGTLRALVVNSQTGGVVQGGSTLTQQLAKNLFLSNERSLERKINEAFLAIWLEWQLTKNEILQLYLERAYMGGGALGVAAAADFYFDKRVQDLNLAESAMLAGLYKAPSRYAPHVNLPTARARASDVLTNLVNAGMMSEGQILDARRNPATPVVRARGTTPDYYLDWAFNQVREMSRRGDFGNERVLIVTTPLDMAIQEQAEEAIETQLRQDGERMRVKQAAMVLMEPHGAVVAMVGGRDYGSSQFNRAANALRQPGSAFKPFVYASVLTHLPYRPGSTVRDAPICLGRWCPQNYNRSFAGAMTMTAAMARSINTIPVRMSVELGEGNARAGRLRIMETAERMGVRTPLADSSSMPIGASEITVMDMASGYAVFANGGKRVEPYAALRVMGSSGRTLYRRPDASTMPTALSPQAVADMNEMLVAVPESGTGRRAALQGIRSAGKTGTTSAYRDAWYAGYTGNFVAAVWFGNDDFTSTARMTGGSLPGQAFAQVMNFAHQGLDILPIPGLGDVPAAIASQDRPADVSAGARRLGMPLRTRRVVGDIQNVFGAAIAERAVPRVDTDAVAEVVP